MGDIVDLQFVKDKKREEKLEVYSELDRHRDRLLHLYDQMQSIINEINHTKNVIKLLDNDNNK
jgi:hypothetical protein